MKIVLDITIEDHDLVIGDEIDEANSTVRHVRIFLLVFLVANMLQT